MEAEKEVCLPEQNTVVLIGSLVQNPETKRVNFGSVDICSFDLCVSKKIGDREQFTHVPILVSGRQVEFCSNYLKKGSPVCVNGAIRSKERKNGKIRKFHLEVIASNVQLLSKINHRRKQERKPTMTSLQAS